MNGNKSETNGINGNNSLTLSYYHSVGKEPLIYRTIGQQLSIVAKEIGDRDAFVFVEEGKRITFSELLHKADHLAAAFKSLGLNKGDRVAIIALNVSTWPIAMFAAARADLIAVHLNPTYSPREIEACLAKVAAKVLVTPESFGPYKYYDKLVEIIPELENCPSGIIQCNRLPSLATIIIDSEKHFTGTHRLCDIMALPTGAQVQGIEDYQVKISPDSGCSIIFTSGFTGYPKAVLLSHFGLINTGFNMENLEIKNSTICMTLPFCHISGSGIFTMGSLCHHATLVVLTSMFDPEKILHTILDEKCNFVTAAPPMFMTLLSKQKELKLNIKDITVLSGGMQFSVDLYKELKKVFKMKKLMAGSGMTEGSGIFFSFLPNDPQEVIIETIGKVSKHLEVKVIDPQGKLVPFGMPGELCVRGYATMIGYWDDEEKTQNILGKDGWLKTGDCFILQPNGYGKVIGRLDEMISKGNDRFYPKEIEELLTACPDIAEAYVVGVPDEQWGEELCAFIRLNDGCEAFSTNDLRDFCQGKIQEFHIPRYVQIVENFPKTMAGKVKKMELKELFCKS